MLRVVSILLVLVATAGHAGSEEANDVRVAEHWRCYSRFDYDKKKVLVEALRFEVPEERFPQKPSATLGVIKVAGMAYHALFYVDGFDRTWTLGPEEELLADKTMPFRFVVRPDGSGFYYDFSDVGEGESTTPSQTYECEEK